MDTLDVTGGWDSLFAGPARDALERRVLPSFLPAQRWFGGKARRIESVRVRDWGPLAAGPTHSFLAVFEVRYADGASDLYCLPLRASEDASGPSLLAELRGPDGRAVLYDALADDGFCTALLDAIGTGRTFDLHGGQVRATPTGAFAALRGDPGVPLAVQRGPETSSNSLVFLGDRLLLKLFRRLQVGVNPDFEVGRFLTEQGEFTRIPKVAGAIEYHQPGSGPITLAILQELVPNEGDGWQHSLGAVRRYLERASECSDVTPPNARELVGSYLDAAALLGRRTGELHLALAHATADPAFTPEPMTAADLTALREHIIERGQQALAALRANLPRLSGEVAETARRLLEQAPRTLERFHRESLPGAGTAKVRVHGDYHLGQVLWDGRDYIILDFEGEPLRPIDERRAKQSPLKDVAGMLRSYHYAAYAGLFTFTQGRPDERARLGPWAEQWQQSVSSEFLRAYREVCDGAPFLPHEPRAFTALLGAFLLDKAFYELVYELNNRPDWVRIPLQGILGVRSEEKP